MKAKLIICMAGDPMWEVGHTVEGDEAIRLVEAGFAVPIVETAPKETASKKVVAKETRSKK